MKKIFFNLHDCNYYNGYNCLFIKENPSYVRTIMRKH